MIFSELWPQVCQWLPQVEEFAEIAFDSNLLCQTSYYVCFSVTMISAYYFISQGTKRAQHPATVAGGLETPGLCFVRICLCIHC